MTLQHSYNCTRFRFTSIKSKAMKLFVALSVGCLVAYLCLLAEASQNDEPAKTELIRTNFKLPALFDFNKFKTLFKKSYSSVVEEMVRKKIFLARAFQSFISACKYKYRQLLYYLGINWMSDWTNKDIQDSKPDLSNMMDENDENAARKNGPASGRDAPREPQTSEPVPVASLNDIEREFNAIEEHKDEPGYRAIAKELEGLKRNKRETDSRGQISFENLMQSPVVKEPLAVMRKVLSWAPGNNANYEPPKRSVREQSAEKSDKAASHSNSAKLLSHLTDNPLSKFIANSVSRVMGSSEPETSSEQPSAEDDEARKLEEARAKYVLPDVDHRDSNCFFQPRNQGSCSSCYAFASIALYEWLYCKQTGRLVAFSEQYIVDCGERVSLGGCKGGNLIRVSNFVGGYGLELRRTYPYRAVIDQCPYEPTTDSAKMGYLKFNNNQAKRIDLDYVHEYIDRWPMMIGLKISPSFHQYGGGIHEMAGCKGDFGHIMLLVGSGHEDGQDYWIIRNSHAVSWGEAGYYRMAKKYLYECQLYSYAVVTTGSLDADHNLSKKRGNYSSEPVNQRYHDYMKKELS